MLPPYLNANGIKKGMLKTKGQTNSITHQIVMCCRKYFGLFTCALTIHTIGSTIRGTGEICCRFTTRLILKNEYKLVGNRENKTAN